MAGMATGIWNSIKDYGRRMKTDMSEDFRRMGSTEELSPEALAATGGGKGIMGQSASIAFGRSHQVAAAGLGVGAFAGGVSGAMSDDRSMIGGAMSGSLVGGALGSIGKTASGLSRAKDSVIKSHNIIAKRGI